MKSFWVKVLFFIGTLLLMASLFWLVIENMYLKDESAVGLRLSHSCLAVEVVDKLNGYYSNHGGYPSEEQWTDVVLDVKTLSEFGCGPFENDASFLEEGLAYKLVSKQEALLYLQDSSGIEKSKFILRLGKVATNAD